MSLSSIFANLEGDVAGFFHSPIVQNLEADFEAPIKKLIGEINWGTLTTSIADIIAAKINTVEAHNKALALAASFLPPGSSEAIALQVATTAANVVAGAFKSVPVPAPPSAATPATPAT